jgi:hypothetical protein
MNIKYRNIKILYMYIDSPQFPKRKVMHDNSAGGGGFGYERMQLANFVAD